MRRGTSLLQAKNVSCIIAKSGGEFVCDGFGTTSEGGDGASTRVVALFKSISQETGDRRRWQRRGFSIASL